MKVSIKSVIKSTFPSFECFEDQQVIFRVGNTICIKEIGKAECQFICMNKHMDKLLSFRAMTSRKGVFVAELVAGDVELAMYGLGGERKAVLLPLEHGFGQEIQKIQLLADEYDNNLLYGAVRGRQTSCIFLSDFSKCKIMALGYLPNYEDLKVEIRQNMTLSVSGYNGTQNYIKILQYSLGQWQISEQILKKITGKIHQHEMLMGGRTLLVGDTVIYVLEDYDLVRTVDLSEHNLKISEVLKIPRGLVVRMSDDSLKLLVDDSDEISFLLAGTIQTHLQQNQKVQCLCVSHNGEEVWLRTTNNDFYVWRCDSIGIEISQMDLVFNKVDTSCGKDKEGEISMSSNKKYALLTSTKSVILWNLQKGQSVLGSQFTDAVDPAKRSLFAGAVNPDGNSIMLAFEDKIKIYKILFTKFKYYAQFPIKRCRLLLYSHSGQLVACKYGKGANSCVIILNLLRMVELHTFKVQAQVSQIFWNELDDQLYVVTESNTIQIYRVSEHSRIHNIKIGRKIEHARLDHKGKRLLVSTEKHILALEGGQIVETISFPLPNSHYVFPLYGVYFIVGKNGVLSWSSSLKFQVIHEVSLFSNTSFGLICRSGNLIAYSSFEEILVLDIARSMQSNNKKKIQDDVVFIEKQQVLGLFDKVRDVQARFDLLNSAYTLKLQQQKQKYEQALIRIESLYKQQIQFTNQKYQELSISKSRQQKQSEQIFEKVEYGQLKNVDEIERMYERKFQHERERYMNLQQNNLQQKNAYERMFIDLQSKYHRDIQNVREEYAKEMKMEHSYLQKHKDGHLSQKKRLEMQLLDMEEETDFTINQIQVDKDAVIRQLRQNQKEMEESYEKLEVMLETQGSKLEELEERASDSVKELKIVETRLSETKNLVKLLQGDLSRKDVMIDERDQVIKEQGHQIADLQKAKYVLSFRTTQIRKELEPKEGLIDKLKSQLLKLDDEYRELKKKNYGMQQKIQKLQTISGISKRQNSDLKISLKYKERLYDQLCSQIFMVINTVDPKDWNSEFIKIYQTHIKQDKHKDRRQKKQDDTSEEINRHLVHVQQSLLHVTTGNDRIMKGKDKEVVRKMKQNSELVFELNVMRKKENQYQKEKKELASQNARLKREIDQSLKTTTRTRTANTGQTRRFIVSRELYSRDKTTTIDISDLSTSKRDMKDLKKEKSRLASARRTLMLQDDIKQKSGKFFDLAKQLEAARSTILRQDRMVEELNQRLLGMPEYQLH